MLNKFTSLFIIATFSLAAGIVFSVQAQQAATQIPMQPPAVVNFTQLADHELAYPPKKKQRLIEQGEDRDKNLRYPTRAVSDKAVNLSAPPAPKTGGIKTEAVSPAPTVSFNGAMDNGTMIPPDIKGAAGPTYLVQSTNQQINIYTKTGTLNKTLTIATFFQSTGGSGYFDPHVIYDPIGGRFIVCIDGTLSNGHGGIFLGVSQTNDPNGIWFVSSFDGTGNSTDFLDFPLLGYNTNWVVITANNFPSGGGVAGKIYVLNRANLYGGFASAATSFTDNTSFNMCPAQTIDNTQTTEFIVQDWNGNTGTFGYMNIGTITGSVNSPVYTLGNNLGINKPWSESAVNAPQKGGNMLEDGDTRICGNVTYINGSLWFAHTVFLPASSPTHAAVDWWQINPVYPFTIQQFNRIEDATAAVFYFYPSINVNANGDALLGYCQSSATTYASAAYSYHATSDAASSMQSTNVYKSGLGNYYKTFGGSRNRWGDYTGIAVDPSDNSFWHFSQWANTSNKWATVIANVAASSGQTCNVPTGMNTTAITSSTATFNWSAVTGATSYKVQYRKVGTAAWATGTSATTSFNASGFVASTNYEWQVQTVCTSGSSAFTASTSFTTLSQPCNAPAGLSTTSITGSAAKFNWSAASGASSYKVQYRIVGTATWSTGTTATTYYNASGLSSGSNYEWQVQTVCAGGSSSFTASTTFNMTGVAPCNAPSGLSAGSITGSTASLTWTAVSGALSYTLQWKLTSSAVWLTVTGLSTNSYNLSGLTSCMGYQFHVLTVCSGGSSAYSTAYSFTTGSCALNYCISKATTTTYEYINKVALGTINSTSGNNNGYADFTAQSTNLAGGTSNSISLTPGYKSSIYREYWYVWIDYNHNGDFSDAGETVASGNGTTALSLSFTVPVTALNGPTRMRVQMEYGAYPKNSCFAYTYGEVEDYSVNITGNAHSPELAGNDPGDPVETAAPILLYPNPAHDNITVELPETYQGTTVIHVYDLMGKNIISEEFAAIEESKKIKINTSGLIKGIYVCEIENSGDLQRRKFMIER